MKPIRITAVAVLIVGSVLAVPVAQAQAPGVTRTDLQQHDLSVPGREAIQVRVDRAPGVVAPNHNHPGEELVYVIEGVIEYQLEAQPPVTLKAGEVLFTRRERTTPPRTSAAATRRSSPRTSSKKASRSS